MRVNLICLAFTIIIAACSNHTDPHIYFLQVQKQAIGESIKNYEKRHRYRETTIEKKDTSFIYRYRYQGGSCIEVIETNAAGVIVSVGIEGVKERCRLNQN